jgi:hypothetical protein
MKPYMTLKTHIILIALALSRFSQSATAQGNLVLNGGFDTSAAGWILANGAEYELTKGNPAGDIALDSIHPSPSTDPTASQTINSLTPGTIYTVSGDYAYITDRGGGSPTTDYSFGVAIDGIFLFETLTPTNGTPWRSFSFSYTASSSSALLSLSSQMNGTGITYSIDNIAMYAAPEPSPSLLILLGSGVLFYVRRKSSRVIT